MLYPYWRVVPIVNYKLEECVRMPEGINTAVLRMIEPSDLLNSKMKMCDASVMLCEPNVTVSCNQPGIFLKEITCSCDERCSIAEEGKPSTQSFCAPLYSISSNHRRV